MTKGKPRRDGTGRGSRANKGRGECRISRRTGKGKTK